MAFAERVQILIDVATGNAKGELGKFKTAVDEAETKTGKFKAGVSSLKDTLIGAATSPAGIIAGVAAFSAVAMKSISSFSNLGTSIGKFADATGLSTEQSSRWIEVADDAGVSTTSLETAITKMEKTAGTTPATFDKLGIAIVKTKDGQVDANATFLSAIDVINGIESPTERAAAAQAVFGKGWTDMAELIGRGAPKLREDLASVQASKVFSADDVKSSRDVRDAFDSIRDAGEGLFLTLGKSLAPIIVQLAPMLAKVVSAAEPLAQAVGKTLAAAFKVIEPLIDAVVVVLQPLTAVLDQAAGAVDWLSKQVGLSTETVKSTTDTHKEYQATLAGVNQVAKDLGLTEEQKLDALKGNEFHMGKAITQMQEYAAEHGIVNDRARALTAESKRWEAQAGASTKATKDLRDANADGIVTEQEATAAKKAATDAANEQIAALKGEMDAQQALSDSIHAAADANFAVADATDSYAESVEGLDKKVKDAEGNQRKIAAAYRENAQSSGKLADALVNQRVKQDEANGVTTSAVTKSDIWNGKMLANAATLQGPARQAIIDYIGTQNQIPADKLTYISALIDQGRIQEAEALIKSASRDRSVAIKVDANTSWAQSAINAVTNGNYVATIRAQVTGLGGIGQSLGSVHKATGGPVKAGMPYRVGEHGEEDFIPAVDGFISPNGNIRGKPKGGTSPTTVINHNTTINAGPGMTPSSLAAELRAHERRNGGVR